MKLHEALHGLIVEGKKLGNMKSKVRVVDSKFNLLIMCPISTFLEIDVLVNQMDCEVKMNYYTGEHQQIVLDI